MLLVQQISNVNNWRVSSEGGEGGGSFDLPIVFKAMTAQVKTASCASIANFFLMMCASATSSKGSRGATPIHFVARQLLQLVLRVEDMFRSLDRG